VKFAPDKLQPPGRAISFDATWGAPPAIEGELVLVREVRPMWMNPVGHELDEVEMVRWS
jgi:hypothetical protein